MAFGKLFQRLSQAPTNPQPATPTRSFDVAELYRGPIEVDAGKAADQGVPLDEKLRQAYFWIVNTAILSPHYDIEFNLGPPQSYTVGDRKSKLTLPTG
jgi:MoxR-like ATPase